MGLRKVAAPCQGMWDKAPAPGHPEHLGSAGCLGALGCAAAALLVQNTGNGRFYLKCCISKAFTCRGVCQEVDGGGKARTSPGWRLQGAEPAQTQGMPANGPCRGTAAPHFPQPSLWPSLAQHCEWGALSIPQPSCQTGSEWNKPLSDTAAASPGHLFYAAGSPIAACTAAWAGVRVLPRAVGPSSRCALPAAHRGGRRRSSSWHRTHGFSPGSSGCCW